MTKHWDDFVQGELNTQFYLIAKGVRKIAGVSRHDAVDLSFFMYYVKDLQKIFPEVDILHYTPFGKHDCYIIYDKRYKEVALELAEEWEKPNADHYKIGMLLGYEEEKVKEFCRGT